MPFLTRPSSFPAAALVLPLALPLSIHAVALVLGWKKASGHSFETWAVILWALYGLAALVGIFLVQFVMLGGLREMRFSNRVLRPSEITLASNALPGGARIPFAEDGCGDSYCWEPSQQAEPSVVFVDHERGESSQAAESFTAWLTANRF